jgi:2-polyprenyl-3-methyl-5-hydroxy-6-metoxy-1,4-benzoquinol methylase
MHNDVKCYICKYQAVLYRKGNIKEFSPQDLKITDSQYGKHWDLYKCPNCKLTFSFPLPDQKLLIKFYSEMKDSEYTEEESGRKRNFLKILKTLEKFSPSKGSLLDIGAASGMLVQLATQRSWDAEGIEPNIDLFQKSLQKNITMYNSDLESFTPKRSYDAITAIDIIEHLYNPELLIFKASNWLKKTGILCIVTPNIGSFMAKIFQKKWWHLRPPHLFYFNKDSINFLLKKYNFKIIACKSYVWHFSLHYLLSRLNLKFDNKLLKSVIIPLYLFDSLEIYAQK